jgi:murein L,D-transpeptidase YafK
VAHGRVVAGLAALALALAGLLWACRSPAPRLHGTRAELLVVHKSARRLLVYAHGSVLRSYAIALGRNPVGAKRREGDDRTPEGRYIIDGHNPNSAFYRSLHISYPSPADAARALAAGYAPGSEIMIHGTPNGAGWLGRRRLAADWTDGCIAVSDAHMDELYRLVPDGTPIEIEP